MYSIRFYMKVKVNENLTSIINYIRDSEKLVTWFELVQFCIDYRMYEELYINQSIIHKLILEHNSDIQHGLWKKPN